MKKWPYKRKKHQLYVDVDMYELKVTNFSIIRLVIDCDRFDFIV